MDDLDKKSARELIASNETALGIELGSTRIKAVLIGPGGQILATGESDWENTLVDDLWSYDLSEVWAGVQIAYSGVATQVQDQYETELLTIGSIGVSAMMHGYLAFDEAGNQLVPFRTWRNTNTGVAAAKLSKELDFNIPHRWSIAHLYQAIIDKEPHVPSVDHITTLAGFVHEKLTGKKVLGVGDASGMFPIDPNTKTYDARRLARCDSLLKEAAFTRDIEDVLPHVLSAGDSAGTLTEAGAALLDPTGKLRAGIPLCPPEADAATGMVATNAIAPRTGNVSAGTSIFAMVVLEKELSKVHPELDIVMTPDGSPVAMAHSNNGASEWDQWVQVFSQFAAASGAALSKSEIYDLLYAQALAGDPAGGDLMAYNFLSGEPIVNLDAGRPLILRSRSSDITLANFMRTQLMTIFGVLRKGMDILLEDEKVALDFLYAHGGLFKTPLVAQKIMAGALNTPVAVSKTASVGGAWGIALLALYSLQRAQTSEVSEEVPELPLYLAQTIFAGATEDPIEPDPADVNGFDAFMQRYLLGLPVAAAAANAVD